MEGEVFKVYWLMGWTLTSKWVRTPVTLLWSLLDYGSWERKGINPLIPPSYTAQLAGAVEYTASQQKSKSPTNKCPGYDIKQSDGKVAVMLDLWVMQSTLFFAIAPRSTLAQSGSTWLGPIYGLKRTIWHLNWVQMNDSFYIELFEISRFDQCVNKWLKFN